MLRAKLNQWLVIAILILVIAITSVASVEEIIQLTAVTPTE